MYENRKLGFMYVLPFVIGVALFKLFPFVMSFALSFTQYDLIEPPKYIGVENYREMFTTDKAVPEVAGRHADVRRADRAAAPRGGAVRRADPQLQAARHQLLPLGVLSAVDPGGSIAVSILWRFIFRATA